MQAFAFEQLGNQEWRALAPADIVDSKNVGMAERGNGPGSLLEAAETVDIGGERCRQNFQRNVAAEAGVAGALHLAHSACPDERDDFVRSKLGSG
jgi:hypothetical protein